VKLLARVVSTKIVLVLSGVALWIASRPSDGSASMFRRERLATPPPAPVETDWVTPDWYPEGTFVDALPGLAKHGPRRGPTVRTASAIVYDIDAGEVLFERNADDTRPVASLTKLVSSLALMSNNPDLDTWLCIGPQHYPTRSGARSRLSTGDCLQGWDVLGGALVASDNRAAYALTTVSGLDMDFFVQRMNEVAADLEMESSSFSDPSGLEDENLSTARDLARATLAVAAHPVLSEVASAPWWDVYRAEHPARRLFTTNHLVGREDLAFQAAKTGYTDTARYCFSTVFETRTGRHLLITLLGAEGKATRWADVGRILSWLGENGSVPADTGRKTVRRTKSKRHATARPATTHKKRR